ncbi:MAG: 23S rRNA (adenine(2503)-C(2))-methyltransferase RlmN [Deltaproteobacteria bacterium]|nr:23S rRNA (adenine(2503)-C(2))-methyltransferase RlmN [Deltaproteobacteria bacterium]
MNILQLTWAELADEFKIRYGKGKYHATAVYREVYKNGNLDFSHVDEFAKSQKLAGKIQSVLVLNPGLVIEEQKDKGLVKFITRLADGLEIESVIIPMATHNTLCVSSQVGCRMGCTFCETGRLGLLRNLAVEEIVGQVYTARFSLGSPIKNIVFMGMGEPFDNFDNVIQAIRVMNDPRGLDIAHSHITLSTAGRIDGIRKLGSLNWRRLNLAVSLNAPNDRLRSKIMPLNRAVPMDKLKESLMTYPLKKSGTFFIEYVLIKGLNDSHEHALELAGFLKPLPVRLNLIPYNPLSDSQFKAPSDEDVHRFSGWLEQENVFVRKRWSKGRSVMAGCGQLGNRKSEPKQKFQKYKTHANTK